MSPEVERLLSGSGIRYRIHTHEPLVSFDAARAVLPFDEAAMIKGLVFQTPDGYAIVAMRGGDRADYKKIADALGIRRAELRLAASEAVAADLDMMAGGVVPLPIRGARVLFDRTAIEQPVIYCGTGRNDSTLEISCTDLLRLASPDIHDLRKAGAPRLD